ncbi:glycogen synthase GlgA [Jeotgalibaca sp. A127]|uniref:glycogen synthase GlgA n=1 Tax=Jeotgalibaca sp. A127 TaxID=3457324 RepID=UPI003FCF5F92
MKILFAAAEAAPFIKTGGLGDVAGALPKELVKQGVDIRVVLPFYSQISEEYKDMAEDLVYFYMSVGKKWVYCGIKTLELEGVTYYFVDNQDYFNRPGLYGEWDDGERFGFFSMAIIEMMEKIGFIPDIIHVNDWQTAMVPVLLVDKYHWVEALKGIRKVITIHNILFQGVYPQDVLSEVFGTGYNIFHEAGVAYYDNVNYLKGGINFSDVVTTVSPSYAQEIQTPDFGEGLDGTLRYNSWKIRGIINGIDYDINNPETDKRIPHHYDITDLGGKVANKKALQERLGLPVDEKIPLIGAVSRLTGQKGFQLVEEKVQELMHTREVQIVILGTGEAQFENSFRYFTQAYPDKFKAVIDFDVALAQQIYSGADIFLMPSAFEPCGLSQMISMRYGTIPIVHEVGGLKDTVIPYNQITGEGTGFSFWGFNGYNLLGTIYRALDVYEEEPEQWGKIIHQAMSSDFSWTHPAQDYLSLYQSLV